MISDDDLTVKTGQDWCYYVFDKWDSDATFTSRLGDANGVVYISDEQRIPSVAARYSF